MPKKPSGGRPVPRAVQAVLDSLAAACAVGRAARVGARPRLDSERRAQPEDRRGKQLLAIAVACKRTGLAHERPDHVSVVDPVLAARGHGVAIPDRAVASVDADLAASFIAHLMLSFALG